MMSRKDYELIAGILREAREDDTYQVGVVSALTAATLANLFADRLAAGNPRFDRDRFLRTALGEEGK